MAYGLRYCNTVEYVDGQRMNPTSSLPPEPPTTQNLQWNFSTYVHVLYYIDHHRITDHGTVNNIYSSCRATTSTFVDTIVATQEA